MTPDKPIRFVEGLGDVDRLLAVMASATRSDSSGLARRFSSSSSLIIASSICNRPVVSMITVSLLFPLQPFPTPFSR